MDSTQSIGLVAAGNARHPDAGIAAREAAREVRSGLAAGQEPGWLLAFAGGRHDPDALLDGFRAEFGEIPIVGGSGSGIISSAGSHISGYECGVLLFAKSLTDSAILTAPGLDIDETAAGRELGRQLRALDLKPERVVLLFYDSLKSSPPPVLHLGSRLLDGLHEALGDQPPLILGAATLSDLDMSDSYVFDGLGITRHTAVAVVLPAEFTGHSTIMHGCLPASDFLEITAIDGARVLELQGQPALKVVEDRLGITREALSARQPLPLLTIGEKHGDLYAPFNDDQYVNRLVVAIDPADESLILFEADFHVGSLIQIMSFEPRRMIESATIQTETFLENLTEERLAFGLYIDCVGRSTAFIGSDEDESGPVREQVAPRCPFIGFYSGVEVAPFMGRARPLDWTGVLLLCTLRD